MMFYAIKHIPTGGYLPSRERRGHTHEEPKTGCVPRLFPKRSSAHLALVAWLKGDWKESHSTDSYTGEWDMDVTIRPRPHRKAQEMIIVPIKLKEVTNERSTRATLEN